MTVTSAAVALQRAIFAVLVNDDDVIGALGKIDIDAGSVVALFDLVPQEIIKAYADGHGPTYATLGTDIFDIAPFDSDGDDDPEEYREEEHKFSIHVFSREVGLLEGKVIIGAIAEAIRRAYQGGTISLSGFALKALDPVSGEFGRLEDGFTGHGAVVLRALIAPTP